MNGYHRAHTIADRTLELLVLIRPSLPTRFQRELDDRVTTIESFLADLRSDENLGRRSLQLRLTAQEWVEQLLVDVEALAARVSLGARAARVLGWLRTKVPTLRGQLEAGD